MDIHKPSLLDVPLSIRTTIYKYIFPPIQRNTLSTLTIHSPSCHLLPLLTCRQIYQEARILAFSSVSFNLNIYDFDDFQAAISVLDDEQVAAVRSVSLLTHKNVDFRPVRNDRPLGFASMPANLLQFFWSVFDLFWNLTEIRVYHQRNCHPDECRQYISRFLGYAYTSILNNDSFGFQLEDDCKYKHFSLRLTGMGGWSGRNIDIYFPFLDKQGRVYVTISGTNQLHMIG